MICQLVKTLAKIEHITSDSKKLGQTAVHAVSDYKKQWSEVRAGVS